MISDKNLEKHIKQKIWIEYPPKDECIYKHV